MPLPKRNEFGDPVYNDLGDPVYEDESATPSLVDRALGGIKSATDFGKSALADAIKYETLGYVDPSKALGIDQSQAGGGDTIDRVTDLIESPTAQLPIRAAQAVMHTLGTGLRGVQTLGTAPLVSRKLYPAGQTLEHNSIVDAVKNADVFSGIHQPADFLANAWNNTPKETRNLPDWMYGTPEKTPELDQALDQAGFSYEKFGDILQHGKDAAAAAPLGSMTQAAIDAMAKRSGFLRGTDAHGTYSIYEHPPGWKEGDYAPKPITMFNPDGSVRMINAAGQVVSGLAQLALQGETDPLMAVHPGVSPAGKALEAARRESFMNLAAGIGDGKPLPTAEAAAIAARPTLGELTKNGMVGVGLGDAFLPLPKSMAPVMDKLQPMFDALNRNVSGAIPTTGDELMRKRAESEENAARAEFWRTKAVPKIQAIGDMPMSPESIKAASALTEVMDQSGLLRVTPKTMERTGEAAWGIPLQSGVPEDLRAQYDKFVARRPDLRAEAEAKFAAGPEHMQPQVREAYEHISTLDTAEQARVYARAMLTQQLAAEVREFMSERGVVIPELNGDVKRLPKQLFDAIDALDARRGERGFGETMGVRAPDRVTDLETPTEGRMLRTPYNEMNPLPTDEPFSGTSGVEGNLRHREALQAQGFRPPEFYVPGEATEIIHGAQPIRPTTDTAANQMSPKLRELFNDATAGKDLSAKQMDELIGQLRAEQPGNRMSVAEIKALRKALEDRVPDALGKSNAAPSYVPGVVEPETRSAMRAAASIKDRNKVGGSPQPDKAVRGLSPADLDKEFKDYADIKGTQAQGQKYYGAGTESTQGRAAGDATRPWFERFMTKAGLKDFYDRFAEQQGGDPFFEPDPIKAIERQLNGPYLKALTNANMDAQVMRVYDVIPKDLVQKIRDAVYDGIDTGRTAPKGPFKFKNPPGEEASARDVEQYLRDKAKAQREWDATKPVAVTRPATMEDLEKIWKDAGRTDTLAENMSPSTLAAHTNGADLKSVITTAWQPFGRSMLRIGEDAAEHGYVHAAVVNALEDYKAFGNDPTRLARFVKNAAPSYAAAVRMWKAGATVISPAFPGYMLMKQLHDLVRGEITVHWDGKSAGEIVRAQPGTLRYEKTGMLDRLPEYDVGAKYGGRVPGETVARWAEQDGVIERSREIGAEGGGFEGNAPSSLTAKAGGAVRKALDATATVADTAQQLIRAQDTANRLAAYTTRLRAGDTRLEAALRVNKAFFDFTRRSPAVAFLSSSGIIPFAAWHAKVIPFMLNWMMTNPGQFMVVQRALSMMGAGQLPPSMLPEYLKDSTNLVTKAHKDENGHVLVNITSDQGIIPGDELAHLGRSIADSGGFSWFQGKLGFVPKTLLAAHDEYKDSQNDPGKRTAAQRAFRIAAAGMGRGGAVVRDLLDDTKRSPTEVLNIVANPMSTREVDLSKTALESVSKAEHNTKNAMYQVGQAAANVASAEEKVRIANIGLAEAIAVNARENDPQVLKARAALNDARARLQRERVEFEKRRREYQVIQEFTKKFSRAP